MASGLIRHRCRGFCARPGSAIKKTLLAVERARSDVAKLRDVWIHKRQPIMRAMPHRLVFIDETSTTTKLTRLRGRALKGERLPGAAPFGHWLSQTFIAALRCHGLTAPWLLEGAMDRTAFDVYIETQLAPTLQPGDVVILDNLNVHESAKAAAVLAARAPGSCFSQPTRPTSIPSRWLSPSSRPICAQPAPGLMTRSGAPSATSAACSSPENAGTFSGTPAMLPIKSTML